MRWLTPIAALAAVAIAAGCGGGDDEGSEPQRTATATAPSTMPDDTLEGVASAAEREEASACVAELGRTVERLVEIDGRLDVGLTNRQLTGLLGRVAAARQASDVQTLGPDCLADVGLPAERAYQSYSRSLGIWDDCIDDPSCASDSIDPELQRIWRRASRAVRTAQDGLREQEAVAAEGETE